MGMQLPEGVFGLALFLFLITFIAINFCVFFALLRACPTKSCNVHLENSPIALPSRIEHSLLASHSWDSLQILYCDSLILPSHFKFPGINLSPLLGFKNWEAPCLCPEQSLLHLCALSTPTIQFMQLLILCFQPWHKSCVCTRVYIQAIATHCTPANDAGKCRDFPGTAYLLSLLLFHFTQQATNKTMAPRSCRELRALAPLAEVLGLSPSIHITAHHGNSSSLGFSILSWPLTTLSPCAAQT